MVFFPVVLSACAATTAAPADSGDAIAADAVDLAADVSPLGPPTWTGIYNDYFGPTGRASCGGSSCHLAGQGGDIASKFICPDQAGCYTSLTGVSQLVLPTDAPAPGKSKLMRNLRQVGNAGKMPSGGSTFVFDAADIARISAWIAAGAQND